MLEIFNSFLIVFIGEMGDKTQLLALVLAARFKRPWLVLIGILIATLLNHGLAAYSGVWIGQLFTPETLHLVLATSFFIFAIWVLVPDKEGQVTQAGHFGILLTTIISFFLAEMGDKTQLATIALGARYSNTILVTVGTTLGMMASNALAIFLGEKFLARIPMKWVRICACSLFFIFGLIILVKYFLM